jgi:hypothetical protein
MARLSLFFIAIIASALILASQQIGKTDSQPATYAGWALDAYPSDSYEKMLSDLKRMKDGGANVIWIAHANPGLSFKLAAEVGVNPAVWRSFNDPTIHTHPEAIEIVNATKRMLQAARATGLRAVVSAGYHTQMGQEWSAIFNDHLRRKSDGKLWKPLPEAEDYASVYSPQFVKDTREYYKWFKAEILDPYKDVVMMINLADEPLGGDYSKWAEAEFKKRNGYGFGEVSEFSTRMEALGEFQSGVVVDYMKLTAGMWNELAPGLPVTMSFDGGAMRADGGLPTVEALFRNAPANFVLSWDMYPRDRGDLDISVNETDITRLFHLTRVIAGYSAYYKKPVWFWSAANSWGLGQDHGVKEPGTVSDAVANMLYLALIMQQQGGLLQGIAVWNYNIKTQGLYNFSHGSVIKKATWNEDEMFNRVNEHFNLARQIMEAAATTPTGPELLFVRPPEWQYRQIGKARADHHLPSFDWEKLDLLARNDIVSAEIGHLPDKFPVRWNGVRTIVVLSPGEFLTQGDIVALRKWISAGGTLLANTGVAVAVTGVALENRDGMPLIYNYGSGRIFVSREPVYDLFDSKRGELTGFWQALLNIQQIQQGYTLTTPFLYMQYNIATTPALASYPTEWGRIFRYNINGGRTSIDKNVVGLQRSELVLAYRFKTPIYGKF